MVLTVVNSLPEVPPVTTYTYTDTHGEERTLDGRWLCIKCPTDPKQVLGANSLTSALGWTQRTLVKVFRELGDHASVSTGAAN